MSAGLQVPHTVLSKLPEITTGRPSSWAVAIACTGPVWPVNGVPMGWPVARSDTRTVPSLTKSVWPVNGAPAGWPVARSDTRTVW